MASLPLFFEEVPEFEPRGDFMLVSWGDFQIAMPISVCNVAARKCQLAIEAWRREQFGKVEQIAHWRSNPS